MADQAPAVALIDALLGLGAVHVPLDRRAADVELVERLALVEPGWLVHDAHHSGRAGALAAQGVTRAVAIEPLLAAKAVRPVAQRDPTAPATIVFTSGTTGRPRAALLSQASQDASADAWGAVLAPRTGDAWLLSLPLHHVAGLAIVRRARRWGVDLRVPRSFDAGELAAELDAGITHLSLVPTQLADLLETWGRRRAPTALRAILVGGTSTPAALLGRAREAGFPVLTTYGMTETCSGIAVGGVEPLTLAEPGTYRPLPGVSLRIGPSDAAAPDVSAGVGPIEIAGPMVFSGYLDDAVATAERLHDGWLRSGDLGSLDEWGLLRVSGRADDVFISGGENVQPDEVEAVLRAFPGVLDAAVLGEPDERWGHVPLAVVVVAPHAAVDDAELRRHCRERLAPPKVPRRVVRVAALPRNAAGKLLRRDLAMQLKGSGGQGPDMIGAAVEGLLDP